MRNKPISIVLDCRLLFASGIGRYIYENLVRLVFDSNFKITCLIDVKDKFNFQNDKKLNQITNVVYLSSKPFSIFEQFEIPFKAPKAHIYWSPQYNIPILCKVKCDRLITTIHDLYQISNTTKIKVSHRLYSLLMFYLCLKISDNIISVSNFTKYEILRKFKINEDKINVIYNGIDSNLLTASESSHHEISDFNYLLLVGNLKEHKNIPFVINAFVESNLIKQNFKLIIVGKKNGLRSKDTKLEQLLQKFSSNVKWLDVVSDSQLAMLYKNASLFIFPSLYEGFGIPILEAAFFGCRVLASNIPTTVELAHEYVTFFNPVIKSDLVYHLNNFEDINIPKTPNDNILKWDTCSRFHKILFKST